MKIKLLDVVSLKAGLPDTGLEAGDSGTVVEVYKSGLVEVEFVDQKGETVALVSLAPSQLRAPTRDELLRWPARSSSRASTG